MADTSSLLSKSVTSGSLISTPANQPIPTSKTSLTNTSPLGTIAQQILPPATPTPTTTLPILKTPTPTSLSPRSPSPELSTTAPSSPTPSGTPVPFLAQTTGQTSFGTLFISFTPTPALQPIPSSIPTSSPNPQSKNSVTLISASTPAIAEAPQQLGSPATVFPQLIPSPTRIPTETPPTATAEQQSSTAPRTLDFSTIVLPTPTISLSGTPIQQTLTELTISPPVSLITPHSTLPSFGHLTTTTTSSLLATIPNPTNPTTQFPLIPSLVKSGPTPTPITDRIEFPPPLPETFAGVPAHDPINNNEPAKPQGIQATFVAWLWGIFAALVQFFKTIVELIKKIIVR